MERGAVPAGRARDPALGRPGAPPGGYYGPPAESRLIRAAQMPPGKRGPGRKEPRWSAERRAGQRHWPVDLRPTGDRPDREAGHGCGVPRPAPVGALPPSRDARGQKGPRRTRRRKEYGWRSLAFFSLLFLSRPACHGDSLAADDPPRATGYTITTNGQALHRRAGVRFTGASVSRAIAPAIHKRKDKTGEFGTLT